MFAQEMLLIYDREEHFCLNEMRANAKIESFFYLAKGRFDQKTVRPMDQGMLMSLCTSNSEARETFLEPEVI